MNSENSSSLDNKPMVRDSVNVLDIFVAALLLASLIAAMFLRLTDPGQTIGLALALAAAAIAPPLVLTLIEQFAPTAGARKSPKVWWLHIQIMLANYAAAVPLAILAAYITKLMVAGLGLELGLFDLTFITDASLLSLIGASIVGLLCTDFFFYWYHRAAHKSNILWQHHKMHHLDPEFDALTGPRQNWLESFFSMLFIFIPVQILFQLDNVDPFSLGLTQGLILGSIQAIVFINHSNLRIQFGRFSCLFTSSQMHRIHHSYAPEHLDKNFVAFFPVWDILFGTYYQPKPDEFPPTGVPDEREISSVWEVQYYALREWWKLFRSKSTTNGE
ncbi:MAG: sterol desaturase family protein [Kordiimonadaceae bacterium]|nr:sterol desaturase family protein [Kordiimonadaceae bacterium]MBT6031243.1 sterol desaturase family protein [Kordiimonadaceae bacterium]